MTRLVNPSVRASTLTFVLQDSLDLGLVSSRPLLTPDAVGAPSTAAWEVLAAYVSMEPTLTPFPAATLRERWERGHAAILLQDGAGDPEILAYTSLVPVFSDATRRALAHALGVRVGTLPQTDVYESMTGWTTPGLRKHGISRHLREPLLERFARPDCLFIGFTVGVGASPVLSRLGWEVAPWNEIMFVGSIIENSTVDCASGAPRGWHVRGLKPYEGPALHSFEGAPHDWAAYCYFWVSEPHLAARLDYELDVLAEHDVCRWRGLWGGVVESTLLSKGWVPIVLEE
jgi:hypothetical protein